MDETPQLTSAVVTKPPKHNLHAQAHVFQNTPVSTESNVRCLSESLIFENLKS